MKHMQGTANTVSLQGQDFHVLTYGLPHLPKLLMLHGFPEFSGAYGELAPHLAGMYHCIVPDQRGYGQSWAPQDVGYYTTSKLVDDMVALIESDLVGGGPLAVIGHDWGAAVAYGLAMVRPDLVERLVIVNGVHPVPFQREIAKGGAQTEASQYIHYLRSPGSEDTLSADNYAKLLALFSAKMNMNWLNGDTKAAYLEAWGRPGRLRGMVNWYRASPLKVAKPGVPLTDIPELAVDKLQVRCPHLLIWGTQDAALLPETTHGLEDFAADLTRVEIEDCDHWVMHQNPEAVADAILDWVIGAEADIP
jgi:pimeloyl-ACP methyl ester carboxylesterase